MAEINELSYNARRVLQKAQQNHYEFHKYARPRCRYLRRRGIWLNGEEIKVHVMIRACNCGKQEDRSYMKNKIYSSVDLIDFEDGVELHVNNGCHFYYDKHVHKLIKVCLCPRQHAQGQRF